MKALTVQQPWAWAIIHGGKDVENRTQAWSYRGPLAIHAGARWSERGARSPLVNAAVDRVLGQPSPLDDAPRLHPEVWLPGSIIGVVDLVGVHEAHQEGASVTAWADWCCQPWGEGHYASREGGRWVQRTNLVHLELANPRPLAEPIPCRGALGLWTPPVDVRARIELNLGAAEWIEEIKAADR